MAPARDSSGKLVLLLRDDASGAGLRRHEEGADAAREERRHDLPDTSQPTAAKGYTLIKGAELFTLDKELAALRDPDARRRGDPGAGRRAGGRAAADAALRRGEEPVRADQRRRRSSRDNGRGSFVSAGDARTSSSPAGRRYIGFRNFGEARRRPAVPDAVPEDLRLDVRLRDDHGARSRSRSVSSSRSRSTRRACASSASTARRSIVPWAMPGLPRPARLGRAC